DVGRLAVDDRELADRGERARVLPGQAHRERAVPVDQADDVLVHRAGQDHADDLHGLRRGHPQPGGERGLHPEPAEHRVDLRAAAVHDDRAQPGVAQEHQVLRERQAQRLVGHGVTAVLDHDRLAVEPVQPGQRLDQRARLGRGVLDPAIDDGHVEYAEFSCTYSLVRSVVRMTAECGPADRSTVIVTSLGFRSTLDRSSPGAPWRQTQIPLIATFSRSGAKTASVVPTADSTRPQLGSSPPMAHLSRLLRATARPAVTASASEAAPTTSMVIILPAPSASRWSWRARSAHTSVSTWVNSAWPGVTPDAPLAISSTVSLVDMQPSVSSRSKVTAVADRSAASSRSGGRSASVVSTHSMVARPGAIIPAPLAIPPME